MENLCEDVLVEILNRLRDEKEVVRCMIVSKSWRRMILDVLRLRFWEQSPVVGLYFRTIEFFRRGMLSASRKSPTSAKQQYITDLVSLSHLHHINYVGVPLRAHHESYPDANRFFIDCCNGLLLLFDLKFEIYYVWNPFTRQRADIPKPVHYNKNILCATLAFDPVESSFYRVVLIGCTNSESDDYCLIDIFSSETGEWNRTRLKLDPFFIQDSKTKLLVPRVYLRGVLYRMSSSQKVSRIEVSSIGAKNRGPIDLPPIPVIDRTVEVRNIAGIDDWGVMGCLGVSMSCLSFCKREWTTFAVWLYYEQSCEWIPRYTVSFDHLKSLMFPIGLYFHYEVLWMEAFAVGPNSDMMFFGLSDRILSYNFKTNEVKLVYKAPLLNPALLVLGCFFPIFTFRTCLLPFQGVDKRSVRYTPLHVAYTPREIRRRNYRFGEDERKLKALMEDVIPHGLTRSRK